MSSPPILPQSTSLSDTGNLSRRQKDRVGRESGLSGRDIARGGSAGRSSLVHLSAGMGLAKLGPADQSAVEKTRKCRSEYRHIRHALDHLADAAGGLSHGRCRSHLPRGVRSQKSLDSNVANQHLESGRRSFSGLRIAGTGHLRAMARPGPRCAGGSADHGAIEPAGHHHLEPGSSQGDSLVASGSGVWSRRHPMAGHGVPCACRRQSPAF